jgi:hypothetical protein
VADPGIDGDPPVVHVLTQDGTLLDTIPLTFACGDLVVLDDGTFWISDYEGNVARRMNAAGDVLEQFNVPQIPGPFYTIAIAADGTFIMGGEGSRDLYRYSADGAFLEKITSQHAGEFPVFMSVVPGVPTCAADCNGDGALNILDFVCFQGLFLAGDPSADCDGNGALNILDFVCFQGAFQAPLPDLSS